MDYVRGLQTLRNSLPSEKMSEFQVYEVRLLENLDTERLYGSTETLRAERYIIISRLNELAHACCKSSFNDMCYALQTSKVENVSSEVPLSEKKTKVSPPSQEKIEVAPPRLLTNTIPTAYYQYLKVDDFPLVTVSIDNTGTDCDDAVVRISTVIQGYSDDAIQRVKIDKEEVKKVFVLPLLKPDIVAKLTEIRPSTLHTTVEQIEPTKSLLYEQTDHIELHARNTALIAVQTLDGSMRDLTKYLAGWVTPHHPDIDKLLRSAAERHYDRGFVGYSEGETKEEITESVREQAQAIFETLKYDVDLVYIDSSLSFGAKPDQVMQRVRFPTEILASGGAANCLDGTVLFASLLECASIDPLIVLVPGHAFVGWHIAKNEEQYEFLETTLISKTDFVTAQQQAQSQFDFVQSHGYFEKEIFDPRGFARLIDVAACRDEGIYPLE